MVRFERKDTMMARAAIASLAKAKAHDSGYNTPEVNDALEEMFHGKCYLCEEREIDHINIEHLTEHGGDLNLKYDWNNLFWSCGHCNSTKRQVPLPILDCSLVDVDQEISFRVLDLLDLDDSDADIEIKPLSNSVKTENTCLLLQKIYYGTTPQKTKATCTKRQKLRKEMLSFVLYVYRYLDPRNEKDKGDDFEKLKQELSNSSAYTAFKRWVVRDHPEKLKDLLPFCQ